MNIEFQQFVFKLSDCDALNANAISKEKKQKKKRKSLKNDLK